jgi:acetylornithine/succinyldiaminopimelate/putrescine aminotransferase
MVKDVRGRGLLNALEVRRDIHVNGHDLSNLLQKYNVITKATYDYSLRFTPPLVITA